LIDIYLRFGGFCCLHLQGRKLGIMIIVAVGDACAMCLLQTIFLLDLAQCPRCRSYSYMMQEVAKEEKWNK
jgi:hypothetical protein